MTKSLYFNGLTELNKETVHMLDGKLVGEPIGFIPVFIQGYGWQHKYMPVNRKVHLKSNPSKHECDARCMNASGRTMNCECACGGKNHGSGKFKCQ